MSGLFQASKESKAMTNDLPHALGELLSWVYGYGRCKRSGVIKRAHVMLWIIRPGMFDFATEKAMAKKLGIRPQKFCEEVTAFRERFKFHSSLCETEERRAARRKKTT